MPSKSSKSLTYRHTCPLNNQDHFCIGIYAFEIIRITIYRHMPSKSSSDPSNLPVDPMGSCFYFSVFRLSQDEKKLSFV